MKPRRAVTYSLYAIAVALIAVAAAAMPHFRHRAQPPIVSPPPPPPIVTLPPTPPEPPPVQTVKEEQPEVDIVFVLDTTSSMSELLSGAKRKIWSLVNYVSSAQPQPKVRIGLVAFRDLGDSYVTRFYDLSDDVDGVFEHLRHFRAEGGGDTPEHVARGLSDAVNKPSWSTGPKVAKIIYVIGDAPGHTDYQDGFDYQAIAKKAASLGIHVNAIRCGTDADAEHYFRRIARLGQGQYSSVDETGGVADETTPFDDKLAKLHRRLMGTTVAYGSGAAMMRGKIATAEAGPAATIADRVTFMAKKKLAVSGDGDLIGAIGSNGKGAGYVNSVPAADLPAPLAAMAPAAREAFVAEKMKEREAVSAEINAIASERSAYLKRAPKSPGKAGFDEKVRDSLKDETAAMGLKF